MKPAARTTRSVRIGAGALPDRSIPFAVEAAVEALIPITLFLSIAAVMILRPITRRLGMLLEAIAREKDVSRQPVVSDARVLNLLEQMNRRVEMIEERLEFTERLVSNRRTDTAPLSRSRHADPDAAFLVR